MQDYNTIIGSIRKGQTTRLSLNPFLEGSLRGLTLLRKNKLSKEITNKTEPIVPIVFGVYSI